jgi:hypothetical protein
LVNPRTRTWGAATPSPPRARAVVATLKGQVIIWGGSSGSALINSGVVLDPVSGTWSNITCLGAPSAPGTLGGAALATDFGIIVFNGNAIGLTNGVLSL